jgi:hypothetical protein
MSELQDVIGAVVAGLARARRIADEESARLAESYRAEPLLEGLTVPRVRVPDMVVDLPILIEEHVAPTEAVPSPREDVLRGLLDTVKEFGLGQRIDLPPALLSEWKGQLATELGRLDPARWSRASVARAALDALIAARRLQPGFVWTEREARLVELEVERIAARLALKREATPGGLRVSVVSGVIKDRGTPETVTRIRLSLREEGLEWTRVEDAEGGSRARLTPE